MGQIASCQYIGSFSRTQYAPPGGRGKMTVTKKSVPLPKLKSKSHCVKVPGHTCACVCTCDQGHGQRCGCGREHMSWPYQLNPLFQKIFAEMMSDERHRKRERDLFSRGNRVTEYHQQSSCLSFSFIQTPNSPLQQIAFQQRRSFCL